MAGIGGAYLQLESKTKFLPNKILSKHSFRGRIDKNRCQKPEGGERDRSKRVFKQAQITMNSRFKMQWRF